MYCRNCGYKNEDDAVFCKECGTKLDIGVQGQAVNQGQTVNQGQVVNQGVPQNPPYSAAVPNTKKPMPKKILIGAALAVVVLVAAIIIIKDITSTVNLDHYIEVTYEGYDGYGYASISVDWDSIEEKYGSKISYTKDATSEFGIFLFDYESPVDLMSEFVDVSLDQTSYLTNGEEITYTWDIDEEALEQYLNCKIKYDESTVVSVAGLNEVETFDPFEDVTVTYEGIAPYGEMSVEYTGDILSVYDFLWDSSMGLSNGDVVTVSINENNIEYYAEYYGVVPSPTSMDYTISGLGEYVSAIADIDDDAQESMKSKAEEIIADYTDGWSSDVKAKSVTYIGSYLQMANEYTYSEYGLIYQINAKVQSSDDADAVKVVSYYYVTFYDLLLWPDEGCEVDLTAYYVPWDSFSKKVYYGDRSYDYNYYWFYGYESLSELQESYQEEYSEYYTFEWALEEEGTEILTSEAEEDTGDLLCSYSSERKITEEEIEQYLSDDSTEFPGDRNMVQMIINEMYALKGYQFKDQELQEYFEKKDWYAEIEDKTDDMDAIYQRMSETEQYNVNLLEQYK